MHDLPKPEPITQTPTPPLAPTATVVASTGPDLTSLFFYAFIFNLLELLLVAWLLGAYHRSGITDLTARVRAACVYSTNYRIARVRATWLESRKSDRSQNNGRIARVKAFWTGQVDSLANTLAEALTAGGRYLEKALQNANEKYERALEEGIAAVNRTWEDLFVEQATWFRDGYVILMFILMLYV